MRSSLLETSKTRWRCALLITNITTCAVRRFSLLSVARHLVAFKVRGLEPEGTGETHQLTARRRGPLPSFPFRLNSLHLHSFSAAIHLSLVAFDRSAAAHYYEFPLPSPGGKDGLVAKRRRPEPAYCNPKKVCHGCG